MPVPKCTSPPWIVQRKISSERYYVDAKEHAGDDYVPVAELADNGEEKANAHAIVAVHQLYDADEFAKATLEGVREALDATGLGGDGVVGEAITKLTAALAAARGETT